MEIVGDKIGKPEGNRGVNEKVQCITSRYDQQIVDRKSEHREEHRESDVPMHAMAYLECSQGQCREHAIAQSER